MSKLFTTVALALALSVTALSPAVAQTGDQPGPVRGMMGGGCPMMGMMGQGMGPGMMGGGMMGQRQAQMGAMIEGRLAYLKAELAITEAQTAAWNGYADAAKARVEAMQGRRKAMMEAMQKGNAIERMDARIKSMETMVAAMAAIKPPMEKLYETLTAEQKTIADQLIGNDCGAM
jgi:ASC-1-like (ASCH) protein